MVQRHLLIEQAWVTGSALTEQWSWGCDVLIGWAQLLCYSWNTWALSGGEESSPKAKSRGCDYKNQKWEWESTTHRCPLPSKYMVGDEWNSLSSLSPHDTRVQYLSYYFLVWYHKDIFPTLVPPLMPAITSVAFSTEGPWSPSPVRVPGLAPLPCACSATSQRHPCTSHTVNS